MTAAAFSRALAVAERAAFLWNSRRALTRSSAITLELLAQFDEHLSRLLSRLRAAEGLAAQLLVHEPPAFKDGFTFVSAVTATLNGAPDMLDALACRAQSDAVLLPALASALAWPGSGQVRSTLQHLLASPSAECIELGLSAAVSHRLHPGTALHRALEGGPRLRACALAVIGRLGLQDSRESVLRALEDDDAACRFWGGFSAIRLGDRAGIPVLGRFATEGGPFATPACDIVLRALERPRSLSALQRLHSGPAGARLAVAAAGIVGDPSVADWLLDAMASKPLARRAAAAFSLISGCDLRRQDLDSRNPPREPLEGIQEGQSAGESAEAPAMAIFGDIFVEESDEDLVWPDAVAVREWWRSHRHGFPPGERYIAGVAIREPALASVLRSGNQSQRAAAAVELALLNPQTSVLDVTAPAHHQLGQLSARHAP